MKQEQGRAGGHHYIAGQWIRAAQPDGIVVTNPYTLRCAGTAACANAAEVDAAVEAAAMAFGPWSRRTAQNRAAWLRRIADELVPRMNAMASVCTSEVGTPIGTSLAFNGQGPVRIFREAAELIEASRFDTLLGNSRVVREPVGVVACIPAWNVPLFLAADKVAAALGAGCTVVLKPSETSPLSAVLLAEAIDAAGLPCGVFNMINGLGPEAGDALTAHSLVDMISYTGSTEVGRHIMRRAAGTIKKVSLELGGKSPAIVLPDADLPLAVARTAQEVMMNAGQICIALSRLLVPRARQEEAEAIASRVALEQRLGDPQAPDTTMGPLATERHRDNVRARVRQGTHEGARLVTGGAHALPDAGPGWFFSPTVFADVDNRMQIAQQEIFGPVLCIIPYDDEAQALEIANDTIYGLNASVWAADTARAVEFARHIRAGKVTINDGVYNPQAPAGGYKQSGLGRERGPYGLEEFMEIKSLQFRDAATARAAPMGDIPASTRNQGDL